MKHLLARLPLRSRSARPRAARLAPPLLLPLLLLASPLAGCSTISTWVNTKPPLARVTPAPTQAADPRFALLLENPNAAELPILSIDYRITLATQPPQSFAITRLGQATISRFSTQQVNLPIPLVAIPPGTPYSISGTVEYLKPGAIAQTLNENGAGGSTLAFAANGTFTP